MNSLPSYPELNRIALLYPEPQVLLGNTIYWTEKRDGSQMRIALVDGNINISTRHQEASEQFQKYVTECPQFTAIKELLHRDGAVVGISDFVSPVIFGELLVKGKSPARFERHDITEFVVFDMWVSNRFISYRAAYAECYHYGLPIVECWAETCHSTLEDLYLMRDRILDTAKEKGREGVVLKAYGPQIFAKEKLDNPKIPIVSIDQATPQLPPLPESEVMGAIAKAHADLGELFMDKTKAMPLIAKYVAEECTKHFCSKPLQKLFNSYLSYVQEHI